MQKQAINLQDKRILVTGSPGFIGANLVMRLAQEMGRRSLDYARDDKEENARDDKVDNAPDDQGDNALDATSGILVSLDNLNDYYDPALKEYRLHQIERVTEVLPVKHVFVKGSVADQDLVETLFEQYRFDIVVHLAAQAGVRYSIDHPEESLENNLTGFCNILEACRKHPVRHFVFASSSSIYGEDPHIPFSTDDRTDEPESLYAATKKCDELLAYAYAKIYGVPATGLRFFTVYGPAGRPDMFYFSAAKKLAVGEKIRVFNHGKCERDFTYIDDIIEGIFRVIQGAPVADTRSDGRKTAPYAIYNIGRGSPVNLIEFLEILQEELVRARIVPADTDFDSLREYVGMQPGDVTVTYADTGPLARDYGYEPRTDVREGMRMFCNWFSKYRTRNP